MLWLHREGIFIFEGSSESLKVDYSAEMEAWLGKKRERAVLKWENNKRLNYSLKIDCLKVSFRKIDEKSF